LSGKLSQALADQIEKRQRKQRMWKTAEPFSAPATTVVATVEVASGPSPASPPPSPPANIWGDWKPPSKPVATASVTNANPALEAARAKAREAKAAKDAEEKVAADRAEAAKVAADRRATADKEATEAAARRTKGGDDVLSRLVLQSLSAGAWAVEEERIAEEAAARAAAPPSPGELPTPADLPVPPSESEAEEEEAQEDEEADGDDEEQQEDGDEEEAETDDASDDGDFCDETFDSSMADTTDAVEPVEFSADEWRWLGLESLLRALRSDHYVPVTLLTRLPVASEVGGSRVVTNEATEEPASQVVFFRASRRGGLSPCRVEIRRQVLRALDEWIAAEASGWAVVWGVFLCAHGIRRLLIASPMQAPPALGPSTGNVCSSCANPLMTGRLGCMTPTREKKSSRESQTLAAATRVLGATRRRARGFRV